MAFELKIDGEGSIRLKGFDMWLNFSGIPSF